MAKGYRRCMAWLMCTNAATTQIDAGVLGHVAACQRCADKYARLSK